MAKRFIDTDIFKKGFVKGLKAPHKLLWLYILNDCNHAGIWDVELDVAALRLGLSDEITPSIVKKAFKGKIQEIDGGKKWFIPSFIEFQYKELNESNRAHKSVILQLKKFDLYDIEEKKPKPLKKPLRRGLQGGKDMVMVKDMDKVKERKGGMGEKQNDYTAPESQTMQAQLQQSGKDVGTLPPEGQIRHHMEETHGVMWNEKNRRHTANLVRRIRHHIGRKSNPQIPPKLVPVADVVDFYRAMCSSSHWLVQNHFSLQTLDEKFDQIVNTKTTTKGQQPDLNAALAVALKHNS